MATEIELKLSLPPGAARALAEHPLLRDLPARRQLLVSTYYDTPQRDLAKKLVAVRWRRRGGRWWLTVKSAEPASGGLATRSEWEYPASPGNFDFSQVDHPKLRRHLEQCTEALTPVFTTRFRRTTWQVDYAGSRIELALDRGAIISGDRRQPMCEVELELIEGEVPALFALAQTLQQDLPLHLNGISKAERGYALFCGTNATPVRAAPCRLQPETPAREAFCRMALNCLDHLQRNEVGARAAKDPEYLHQARIAVRRLRSCIQFFAPALPPEFVAEYGSAWRDFAHSLNAARNWDVFAQDVLPALQRDFADDRAVHRLASTCRREGGQARRAAARRFATPEYCRLLLAFSAALQSLFAENQVNLGELIRKRYRKRDRQARELAKHARHLDDTQRHRLRIGLKKLRYILEFIPCDKGRKPYLAALGQLQEELGRFNDHVTALEMVAQALPAQRPGLIHGWLSGRRALLAEELDTACRVWLAQQAPKKYW